MSDIEIKKLHDELMDVARKYILHKSGVHERFIEKCLREYDGFKVRELTYSYDKELCEVVLVDPEDKERVRIIQYTGE